MSKGDIAKELFLSGYNCSSSVVLAFKEELKIDEETLKKLSIGFGGGLARQRLTCGAVSGMAMVLSAVLSDGTDKTYIYSIIKESCDEFKAQTGSVICEEMLKGVVNNDGSTIPETRTKEYYQKRPCAELCKLAGDIVERIINSRSK